MLDVHLEVSRVDYRSCVEVLLPQLISHCAEKRTPNELDSYLCTLGAEAVPAACSLLETMATDEKDEMIVWLVAAHEERLKNAANRHLTEVLDGEIIRIGRFAAVDRPGDKLELLATQVEVDYPGLMNSRAVDEGVEQLGSENSVLEGAAKLALKLGRRLSSDNLEKQCIFLLNTPQVKSRLMFVLEDAVRQEGVDVTVENMTVERSASSLTSSAAGSRAKAEAFEARLFRELSARVEKLRNGGAR